MSVAIVNDTAEVRYIDWGISSSLDGETALGCELSADGSGASWEWCDISPGCYHPCSSCAPGDECDRRTPTAATPGAPAAPPTSG